MATEITLKLKDAAKLSKIFNKAPDLFIKKMDRAVLEAGFILERESKRIMPVDTGRMRQSTHTERKFLVATVRPETNYALFVHEGTRHQKSQPFFTKTARSQKKKVVENFQRRMEELSKELTV